MINIGIGLKIIIIIIIITVDTHSHTAQSIKLPITYWSQLKPKKTQLPQYLKIDHTNNQTRIHNIDYDQSIDIKLYWTLPREL